MLVFSGELLPSKIIRFLTQALSLSSTKELFGMNWNEDCPTKTAFAQIVLPEFSSILITNPAVLKLL